MQEDNKQSINKKTSTSIQKETLSNANKIIEKDNSNIDFKIERNKAGDIEYHRYEDNNPNDTNPARLTGIFSQNEMNQAIQARKEDSFYGFEEGLIDKQPLITDDDADTSLESPPIGGAGGTSSGLQLYAVVNGNVLQVSV